MKTLLSVILLTAGLVAQLPPIPAQSLYEVGKADWVMPCGNYMPYTYMTTQPWNRTVDPSYPGTTQRWSINAGGLLFCRAIQHSICPDFMPVGTGFAPFFIFGPRTGSYVSLASIPGFQLGQSNIFNYYPSMALRNTEFGGPWEFDSTIQAWGCQIWVPNNVALVGQEFACQALFLTTATMTFNLGGSHYTKVI